MNKDGAIASVMAKFFVAALYSRSCCLSGSAARARQLQLHDAALHQLKRT
jgi:hypothetical protein